MQLIFMFGVGILRSIFFGRILGNGVLSRDLLESVGEFKYNCSVLIEMPSLKPLVLKKIFPTPNHYLHEGVIIERNADSENL